VKDLEPTAGHRHHGEGKNEYITGILTHDIFSPKTFIFVEDGQEGGQDVLETSLDKIKKAGGDNNPSNNNPSNNNNNNMSGGGRRQSRKQKRKSRATRRR